MTATDLVAGIREKELSPVEVAEAVIARLEEVNPQLNAVVTVTAELARESARAAEHAVIRGDVLGRLHGVPYTLKDMTETKGIRTTFGSKLFEHNIPNEDAVVAARLRDAGGILLGKTNTPDSGCKGLCENRVFGATRNPWARDRTPGGSSGGAAAAVAAGIGPLAEGGDFAGSIRIPAAFCGVVGLKPSEGRIPSYPNPTIWHPVSSCHGPIARTVLDAALMLDVMAGPDTRDPRSLPAAGVEFASIVAGDVSIDGRRIGWTPDLGFVPVEPVVRRLCEEAVRSFEDLGAYVESIDVDFRDAVDAYALLNANYRGALIDLYLPDRADEIDPLIVARATFARKHSAIDVASAEIVQSKVYERVRGLFEQYDLLILPTAPVPAFELGVDYPSEIAGIRIDTPFEQLPLTFLFNMTGHPAITVPAGWTEAGLPVGLQIAGPWRNDAAVLRAAAAYERVRPWRDRWPSVVSEPRSSAVRT
jgi:Asp-tRNA(Asn)/Glu-tRNA(Gln) amidotransferase A subunit family amidase